MPTYFTLPEAQSKLGKTVVLKTSLYQLPQGATGKVIDTYKMNNLLGLIVSWGDISDGFSKDDYDRFLEEG